MNIWYWYYPSFGSLFRSSCWQRSSVFTERNMDSWSGLCGRWPCFRAQEISMLIWSCWCLSSSTGVAMSRPQNLSVVVSTLLTLVLLNRKIAESIFHLLHERKRLWFATLLLSMVCYALPYMNSMFLFTVSVAAVFYPSERVLLLKSHPEAINNPKDLLALIIRNYH